MAKVGEGDQRWIVNERQDGKNVGNWHWSETNCLKLAEEGLREALEGSQLFEAAGCEETCVITDLKKCTGDCYTYNRKGNMYLFYDMNLNLAWKVTKGEESAKGTIELPNVSDDLDEEVIEMLVSSDEKTSFAKDAIASIRKHGRDVIQTKIVTFLHDLKDRIASKQPAAAPSSHPSLPAMKQAEAAKVAAAPAASGTETVELKYVFQCPPHQFYDAMTNPMRVMGFTGAPAKMEVTEGGKFELFDGRISGEYKEIVPDKKIVQSWRMAGWAEGVYSTVTIALSGDSETLVSLSHVDIPTRDTSDCEVRPQVEVGWRSNYFVRMRAAFGWHFTDETN